MIFSRSDEPGQYRPLLAFLLLTLGVGALGSLATEPNIPVWYAGLVKPAFSPPNWLFAPVWTALYMMMAVATWRVWRITGTRGPEMAAFAIQLALNCAWSFIFFAAHQIGAALAELSLLWLSVLAALILFWRRDRIAGALFLPYLAWTSFAWFLNLAIWQLND